MTVTGPANGEQKPATAARIYDYLLGGTHNFAADREAAKALTAMFPSTPLAAQVNRAFLRRAVRALSDSGVRQFLDIGSGIPTEGNVHEIAQQVAPGSRVAYVDIDPVAVAESLELLEGNPDAIAVRGDVREPQAILDHPQLRKLLDFGEPVGLLLVAVLHFVDDDDTAYGAVSQLMGALAPGSCLVISHVVDEVPDDVDEEDLMRVHEIYKRQTASLLRLRARPEIARFFGGLDLLEPGLVWLTQWRPEPGDPAPGMTDLARYVAMGGVGRLS